MENSRNVLNFDNTIQKLDTLIPCSNEFNDKTVRAVGEWNNWLVNDDRNIMKFDEQICSYVLSVIDLKQEAIYKWRVNKRR